MIELTINEDLIPKYETKEDIPNMNPGSIVYVSELDQYLVEDGE